MTARSSAHSALATDGATDGDLLAEYVRSRSSDAFGELVNRYVGIVHAAALRQTAGDAHLAEDVTQAVFIILSQRARSIRAGSTLAGWLLLTTRYAARNAMRHEQRLKRRERKAAEMVSELQPANLPVESVDNETRTSLMRVLDDALARLGTSDRDALLLRFFQSKTHGEIGTLLGWSEAAATKRVSRALVKLRELLARAGVSASEATLGMTLPTLATAPTPAALVTAIQHGLSGAAAMGGAAAPSSFAATIAKSYGKTTVISSPAFVTTVVATIILLASVWAAVALRGATARSATGATAAVTTVRSNGVTIVAIDPQTKKPIADALVEFRDDLGRTDEGRTDAEGRFELPVPERFAYLRISLAADGHVPMGMDWSSRTFRGGMPASVTVMMEKGIPLGGIVRDSAGKPVSGSPVSLNFYPALGNGRETPAPLYKGVEILTDADGRWRIENGPSAFDGLVSVSVPRRSSTAPGDYVKLEELTRFTNVLTLTDDTFNSASGTVVGPDGKPVAGALVVAGRDRFNAEKPTAETDALGRFSLDRIRPWSNVLTVTADGFAPELVKLPEPDKFGAVDANGAFAPVTIRLASGVTLSGRVVLAPEDQPLDGMHIDVEQWRGSRSLSANFTTDNEGRFTWKDAPPDDVMLNVYDGRRNRARRTITVNPAAATTQPLTIVAYPPLHIIGTVIDAQTRTPIPKFTVMHGTQPLGDRTITYESHLARTLADGRFDATLDNVQQGAKIKVEAEGYVPAESRLLRANESGDIVIDFELTKGAGVSGSVIDTDGKPAAGQNVYLVAESASLTISDLYETGDSPGLTSGKTDDAGQFHFKPSQTDAEDFAVVVRGAHGFAIATKAALQKDRQVKLLPYARLEGTFRIGTKPAVKAHLVAQCMLPPQQVKGSIGVEAHTDAEGKFSFDRIPPGTVHVTRAIDGPAGSVRYSPLQKQTVNAGETVSLQLGGHGRPVVAKLIAPPAVKGPIDVEGLFCKTIRFRPGALKRREQLPYPPNFPDLSAVDQEKWWNDFYETEAGKRFREQEQLDEQSNAAAVPTFLPNPDGSIRADDVPPGRYRLTINLSEPFGRYFEAHSEPKSPAPLGHAEVTFDVPADNPKPPTDEPFTLDPIRLLSVDQDAPANPFTALRLVTAEGAPVKLSDFRGKFVIVHVWSMNNTPLVPALQRIYQSQRNDKLQIINVCANTLPRWAKHISERERMPGLLTLDEDTYNGDGPRLYEELGIPDPSFAYVLTPDGKLLLLTENPDELQKSIADALR